MSWSVSLLGSPEGVGKELDAIGEGMAAGQSKDEYMEALPHLKGLVALAVGTSISLSANGHATITNGVKTYGSVQVTLTTQYVKYCQ